MAETLVAKDTCEACGSAVREGSAFCFNCGESIADEPPPPAILKPAAGLLNGRDLKTEEFRDPEPPPVAIPLGRLDETPAPAAKTEKFPTAARRRPPRTRVRKVAEVEWVEGSSSAAAFVVCALVFALLTALLVVAALYLR